MKTWLILVFFLVLWKLYMNADCGTKLKIVFFFGVDWSSLLSYAWIYIDMINEAKINNHNISQVIKISSHIFRIMIYVCENCQHCLYWSFDLAFWVLFCYADNLS